MYVFLLIVIVWNIVTFVIMGIDKRKALHRKWRIKEMTLFSAAFLLGGIGILWGMYVFHHKTRHMKFRILIPLSVLTNMLSFYYVYKLFLR